MKNLPIEHQSLLYYIYYSNMENASTFTIYIKVECTPAEIIFQLRPYIQAHNLGHFRGFIYFSILYYLSTFQSYNIYIVEPLFCIWNANNLLLATPWDSICHRLTFRHKYQLIQCLPTSLVGLAILSFCHYDLAILGLRHSRL